MAEATKQSDMWAVIAVHPSPVARIVAVVADEAAAKAKRLEMYQQAGQGALKILRLVGSTPADPLQTEVSAVRNKPKRRRPAAGKKGGEDDGK